MCSTYVFPQRHPRGWQVYAVKSHACGLLIDVGFNWPSGVSIASLHWDLANWKPPLCQRISGGFRSLARGVTRRVSCVKLLSARMGKHVFCTSTCNLWRVRCVTSTQEGINIRQAGTVRLTIRARGRAGRRAGVRAGSGQNSLRNAVPGGHTDPCTKMRHVEVNSVEQVRNIRLCKT